MRVRQESQDRSVAAFYGGSPTDDEGRFRYLVPRTGDYELTAISSLASRKTLTVTVDEGQPTRSWWRSTRSLSE